jgi:hypothetical protein
MRQRTYEELVAKVDELLQPIDMVLHCPKCGLQHIDRPDPEQELTGTEYVHADPDNADSPLVPRPYKYRGRPPGAWTNPPHKSHLCRPQDGGCSHVWRPCDRPTNGVWRTASGKDGDCDPHALYWAGYTHACNIHVQRQIVFPEPGNLGGIDNARLCPSHGGTGPQPFEPCPLCAAIDRQAHAAVAGRTWCEACASGEPCGREACPNRHK